MGGDATDKYATEIGGTRHLSAAQFIHDQQDCIAMVASQDGHFTIFSWSPIVQKVQAHRIESLLI
jgi:DNA integrity scanning protein DisA with diadenylate cyclase activity